MSVCFVFVSWPSVAAKLESQLRSQSVKLSTMESDRQTAKSPSHNCYQTKNVKLFLNLLNWWNKHTQLESQFGTSKAHFWSVCCTTDSNMPVLAFLCVHLFTLCPLFSHWFAAHCRAQQISTANEWWLSCAVLSDDENIGEGLLNSSRELGEEDT